MKSQLSSLNVFVYGTLKPGEANYQNYCQGKVRSQVPFYTFGDLYALSVGYPAMTVGNNKVKGVLLTFDQPEILKNLDRLEGFQEKRAANLNEYYRQLISIYCLSDRSIGQAWAYFMTLERVRELGGIFVASGWWTGNAMRK
jgi:gamma-glutamylcyclotransferase (GGCT)/AIG2-like uncharacterized protein YtfP